MIILVGLCLAVMTFLHWVIEPLEVVVTPALQLNLIPWAGEGHATLSSALCSNA